MKAELNAKNKTVTVFKGVKTDEQSFKPAGCQSVPADCLVSFASPVPDTVSNIQSHCCLHSLLPKSTQLRLNQMPKASELRVAHEAGTTYSSWKSAKGIVQKNVAMV